VNEGRSEKVNPRRRETCLEKGSYRARNGDAERYKKSHPGGLIKAPNVDLRG
jgi:hypothetical protein